MLPTAPRATQGQHFASSNHSSVSTTTSAFSQRPPVPLSLQQPAARVQPSPSPAQPSSHPDGRVMQTQINQQQQRAQQVSTPLPVMPRSQTFMTPPQRVQPNRADLVFTTYDIASLSGLVNDSPEHFQHNFCQAMFNNLKVDQLKATIRYIRDLYYKQRITIPRFLIMNARKQTLIDGLVDFVRSTAKQCMLHFAPRMRTAACTYSIEANVLKACTCYPSDEAARNAAAIADAAVLKALTEIPDFRCIEGLYSDIEVLDSAFLRGNGPVQMRFKLEPVKVAQVLSGAFRIFLRRFCPHSSRYEPVDNRILVRVNGQTVIVPPQQFDSKKNPKSAVPIDISSWIRHGEQHVFVSSHIVRSIMTVQFVRVLSVAETIEMIKKKDEIPEPTATTHVDDDDDIRPSNMLVSLRCPLSMIRMKIPARATTCNHQQCFDLESVVSYCKQYNKWSCPICCSPIKHDDIRIDSFSKRILAGAHPDIDQANIGVDGSIQYIDAETERRKQEILEERMIKRRRLADEKTTAVCDVAPDSVVIMDGSSIDRAFVID